MVLEPVLTLETVQEEEEAKRSEPAPTTAATALTTTVQVLVGATKVLGEAIRAPADAKKAAAEAAAEAARIEEAQRQLRAQKQREQSLTFGGGALLIATLVGLAGGGQQPAPVPVPPSQTAPSLVQARVPS